MSGERTAGPSGAADTEASGLRRLLPEKPVLAMLWVAGLYLLYVTVSYYVGRDRLGGDAHAYWLTGRPWYVPYQISPNHNDAYLYSPAFAQLIRPLTWMPWPAFLSLWIAGETCAFLWLLRPLGWRWALPLVLWCSPELVIGNVLGFLAVALVAGFARPATWSAFLLTKPVLGLGAVWFLVRREWRRSVVAFGVTAAIVSASVALDPTGWGQWMRFLMTNAGRDGGLLWARALLALVIVVWAALRGHRWALPVALLIATPVFAGAPSLTILAAVPRLLNHHTRRTDEAAPRAQADPGPPAKGRVTERQGR